MGYARPFELDAGAALGSEALARRASKLLGLELVRFTCAFAVLLWHYRHFYSVDGAPAFRQDAQPLHSMLAPLFDYGLFGVQLFWGISGFIFFWKYGPVIAERTISATRFFWLRFSRLYPLHLATLLLVAMLQPIHVALTGQSFIYQDNGWANFVGQLFMATHWGGSAPYSFNGPFWSVSAEVAVYALFFLMVRQLGAGWLTVGAGIAASLIAQSLGLVSPVLFCACYFFAGGAGARLLLDGQVAGRSKLLQQLSLLGLVLIGSYVWLGAVPLNQQSISFLLLVGTPPLLIVAGRDWPALDRWSGTIQAAGNLTYSTYLIHFPLQLGIAIGFVSAGVVVPVQSPWFLIAYLGATLVAGRWLFLRFEGPAQSWIRNRALKPGRTLAAT